MLILYIIQVDLLVHVKEYKKTCRYKLKVRFENIKE